MRKTLLALALFASTLTAHAAGQYDGIWLESADGTYTVYSTIYTASNGMLYKIDVEPGNGRALAGMWVGTSYGMLTGNMAVVSGETDNCTTSLTITFTSATTATMRVNSATALSGHVCDMPQGESTTLHKLL
jgi:hypothetical protein